MAILKAISYSNDGSKPLSHTVSGLGIVLNYAMKGEKTKDENEVVNHVSGVNCNPLFAKDEFVATKTLLKKRDGVLFYHYVQSFSEHDDITPEEAHEIGLEFAKRAWPDYEVVVATHTDTHCLHNHFILNSVNTVTGEKYRTNYAHLCKLRDISDEICIAHGLNIVTPKKEKRTSGVGNNEYQSAKKGESWKFRLRSTIKRAMEKCGTKEAFIKYMNAAGYEVRWDDKHKNIKYVCTKEKKYKNGKYPECNDDKLSDEKYLKGNMENEFEIRKEDEYGRAYGAESNDRRRADRRNSDGDNMRKSRSEDDGNSEYGRTDIGADEAKRKDSEYSGDRRRSSEIHRETGEDVRREKSEFGSGMGEETRRTETGWESEREKYRANRAKNQMGAGKSYKRNRKSMDEGMVYDSSISGGIRGSLLSHLPRSPIIEDENKTPEEIEAEERARLAASNFGAILGLGIALALNNGEEDETEIDENEEDDFVQNM